ncbi:hypothetical protein SAMN05428953_106275 [Mesorhizobium muleiense]|uniref:Uncharacterized protein n=1 Tax=Mesorhizobium muleiense TaxID=1004279 RepID=A0A1G8U441_9HYPH|nr:hypothetical protein SAMN05428953_106275 [Mesorhizobium muleiense]
MRRALGCCLCCRYRKTAAHPRSGPGSGLRTSLCATCIGTQSPFQRPIFSGNRKPPGLAEASLHFGRVDAMGDHRLYLDRSRGGLCQSPALEIWLPDRQAAKAHRCMDARVYAAALRSLLRPWMTSEGWFGQSQGRGHAFARHAPESERGGRNRPFLISILRMPRWPEARQPQATSRTGSRPTAAASPPISLISVYS